MTVQNEAKFKKIFKKTSSITFSLKMALATFRAFSKVDFCVIVQNIKAQATNSGFIIETEKTKFSMNDMTVFIVGFLGFVGNNNKSARKLNE